MDTTVLEHGAAGDGDLATDAFQAALDAVVDAGGGTVRVPPGDYTVGTVEVGDDTTLHLDPDATVHASQDERDYRAVGEDPGPDGELPFLVADGAANVTLSGRGTFDGHGTDVMEMDEPIRGHSGQVSEWPLVSEGAPDARQGDDYLDRSAGTEDWPVAKPDFRPGPMFRFADCENVVVRDLTFRDMPSWTLHFRGCEEVDVLGVDVLNHMLIPNCDGLAVVSSRNVHVADSTFVACDDTIVPGASADAGPLEHFTVTNCTLASHACAIKFGSGTAADIRDCTFQNCTIYGSNRGLGIQHRDQGDIENVLFSDITIRTTLPPGPWWGKAEPIHVSSVPRHDDTDLGAVRNVRFSNVVAQAENGVVVYGHEDASIENLSFDGLELELADADANDLVGGNLDLQPTSVMPPILAHDVPAVLVHGVDGVDVSDVSVTWTDEMPEFCTAALGCEGVSDVEVDGLRGAPAHSDRALVELDGVDGVSVRNCRVDGEAAALVEASGVEGAGVLGLNDAAGVGDLVTGDADFSQIGNQV